MAHFGVLAFHGAGHLHPLIALSQELRSRGHRVTFLLPAACERLIREHGLGFAAIEIEEGALADASTEWTAAIRSRLARIDREIEGYLRAYPSAIREAGIDALLMGEITLAGPTVAELLGLPYVVISTSIPHNFGWDAPESLLPQRTWQQRLHARVFEVSIFRMRGPVRRLLDRHRCRVGLGLLKDIGASHPERAHITQWPRCMDRERAELPERFFYTGPFAGMRARASVAFPWERLDGRRVVYASLGTTRKGKAETFHCIAEACARLDVQLVMTLGGARDAGCFRSLPGDPVVVENAPQMELLEFAEVVVTHAGPNTALETLLAGKPMLAMPMALDQPPVAAHLERLGVAEVLGLRDRSVANIENAVRRLLAEERYAMAARAMQAQLQGLRGVTEAAGIIERVLHVA